MKGTKTNRIAGSQVLDSDSKSRTQLILNRGTGKLVIPLGSKIVFVDVNKVTHIEACNYYALVHETGKPFLVRKTMEEFEEVLPGDQFVRIHRSVILNIGILEEIARRSQSICARTTIGKTFRVSRQRVRALRERIFNRHSTSK